MGRFSARVFARESDSDCGVFAVQPSVGETVRRLQVMPNKSPEPTAVGACSSAIAVHVASRRWLSFFR